MSPTTLVASGDIGDKTLQNFGRIGRGAFVASGEKLLSPPVKFRILLAWPWKTQKTKADRGCAMWSQSP